MLFEEQTCFSAYLARQLMIENNPKNILTKIYRLSPLESDPVRHGTLIMERAFTGSGAMKHSQNWVDKLEREVTPQPFNLPPPPKFVKQGNGKTWKDYTNEYGVNRGEYHFFIVNQATVIDVFTKERKKLFDAKDQSDLIDTVGDILVSANVTPFSNRVRIVNQVVEAVQNVLQ